jgi:excisionase family DNA binding protein
VKKDAAPEIPEIMTVDDLAEYLKVHYSTVYRLLKRSDLPGFRLGSDWRFRRAEIDRWIAQQQVGPSGNQAGTPAMRQRRKK